MPTFLSQLRNVVWTAIFALVAGWASLAAALFGASVQVVLGLGFYGLIMATISPRS